MVDNSAPAREAWRIFMSVLTFGVIVVILVPATVTDAAWRILLLKAFLIFALAFLPGWLYLQFIGLKGWTIYDEYVLNLHRLRIDSPGNLPPPPSGTPMYAEWLRHVAPGTRVDENIYLKKFESVYGESAVPPSRRTMDEANLPARPKRRIAEEIRRERFGPVVFATAAITVGWATVLQPELYRDLVFLGEIELSGVPSLPAEPLRAGFIGAYAFIVQSLMRRYYQQDLKSRAYIGAVVRLVVVSAFVIALHPLWAMLPDSILAETEQVELAVAFFLGFFPELGLRLLAHRIGTALRRRVDSGESQYPLRELDGCSLYAQARLLEEGVEDMQNLASANLVDLLLNTRTPIARLLDWVDQSFLYLRVQARPEDGRRDDAATGDDRALLRRYGIRTAADVCDLFEERAPRSGEPGFDAQMLRILNAPGDGCPSRLEGLYRSLANETNLWHVRQWKRRHWLEDPSQGHAEQAARTPALLAAADGASLRTVTIADRVPMAEEDR